MHQPKIIVSSVGTSVLTNPIDRGNPAEKSWFGLMNQTANYSKKQLQQHAEAQSMVQQLIQRAQQKLQQADVKTIRRLSAELNGIYGIYDNQLDQRGQDQHILIRTDTAQGHAAAHLLEKYLRSQGIQQIIIPELDGFSTQDTVSFNQGIESMLMALDFLKDRMHSHRISFNLVGGFKSMQAYLNTLGMFYAHEIVYIFEGSGSEMIRIPRLPIQVDYRAIDTKLFALMAVGEIPYDQHTATIAEALVTRVGDEITLSNWGQLIWNQVKQDQLSGDLLEFEYLTYQPSFNKDYQKATPAQRVQLQQTLAKVNYLLSRNRGDLNVLKQDSSLQYDVYTNKKGIGHFRLDNSSGWRISCTKQGDKLSLRRFGPHEINDNP